MRLRTDLPSFPSAAGLSGADLKAVVRGATAVLGAVSVMAVAAACVSPPPAPEPAPSVGCEAGDAPSVEGAVDVSTTQQVGAYDTALLATVQEYYSALQDVTGRALAGQLSPAARSTLTDVRTEADRMVKGTAWFPARPEAAQGRCGSPLEAAVKARVSALGADSGEADHLDVTRVLLAGAEERVAYFYSSPVAPSDENADVTRFLQGAQQAIETRLAPALAVSPAVSESGSTSSSPRTPTPSTPTPSVTTALASSDAPVTRPSSFRSPGSAAQSQRHGSTFAHVLSESVPGVAQGRTAPSGRALTLTGSR